MFGKIPYSLAYSSLDFFRDLYSRGCEQPSSSLFALGIFLLIIPFYIIAIIGMTSDSGFLSILGFSVYGIVALGILIPSLAVAVRRMHDINKTGWLYLLVIIPLIGPIIILIWFFTDGDRFTNNYGPDPKNPTGDFDFEQQPGAFQ